MSSDAIVGEVLPAARNVGGAPSKYNEAYCDAIVAHAHGGGSLTAFAATLLVSRRTLNIWADAHPEFAEAMAIAKAIACSWYEERLRNIVDGKGGPGSAQTVIFALKNLGDIDWKDEKHQKHHHGGEVKHAMLTYEEAIEEAARRGLPKRVLDE